MQENTETGVKEKSPSIGKRPSNNISNTITEIPEEIFSIQAYCRDNRRQEKDFSEERRIIPIPGINTQIYLGPTTVSAPFGPKGQRIYSPIYWTWEESYCINQASDFFEWNGTGNFSGCQTLICRDQKEDRSVSFHINPCQIEQTPQELLQFMQRIIDKYHITPKDFLSVTTADTKQQHYLTEKSQYNLLNDPISILKGKPIKYINIDIDSKLRTDFRKKIGTTKCALYFNHKKNKLLSVEYSIQRIQQKIIYKNQHIRKFNDVFLQACELGFPHNITNRKSSCNDDIPLEFLPTIPNTSKLPVDNKKNADDDLQNLRKEEMNLARKFFQLAEIAVIEFYNLESAKNNYTKSLFHCLSLANSKDNLVLIGSVIRSLASTYREHHTGTALSSLASLFMDIDFDKINDEYYKIGIEDEDFYYNPSNLRTLVLARNAFTPKQLTKMDDNTLEILIKAGLFLSEHYSVKYFIPFKGSYNRFVADQLLELPSNALYIKITRNCPKDSVNNSTTKMPDYPPKLSYFFDYAAIESSSERSTEQQIKKVTTSLTNP